MSLLISEWNLVGASMYAACLASCVYVCVCARMHVHV